MVHISLWFTLIVLIQWAKTYTDCVNTVGENIHTIKKNTNLLGGWSQSKHWTTKYTFMYHEQNTQQNQNIQVGNRQILQNCGEVTIFGHNPNTSKLHS
jgi:hypothetical protein